MKKEIDVLKDVHENMKKTNLKVDEMDEIVDNIELNDMQMNQLEALDDAHYKTNELGELFITEIDSAKQNGVWSMEISCRLLDLLEG